MSLITQYSGAFIITYASERLKLIINSAIQATIPEIIAVIFVPVASFQQFSLRDSTIHIVIHNPKLSKKIKIGTQKLITPRMWYPLTYALNAFSANGATFVNVESTTSPTLLRYLSTILSVSEILTVSSGVVVYDTTGGLIRKHNTTNERSPNSFFIVI